ncbi:hypothetical protein BC827DRAFT_1271383 [Russula dissimulans]|nr:hypothetical protein BC827DRAFT_1271383 [Russula dissimulans]
MGTDGNSSTIRLRQGHQSEPDDPFLSPGDFYARANEFTLPNLPSPSVQENFDLNVSSSESSSEEGTPQASNIPTAQHPASSSPRQQTEILASRPAGSRRSHLSTDTLSFFEISGDKRKCKFCV